MRAKNDMSDQFCEHESAVIHAARSGKWEESLRSHAQLCPMCAEAMRVHAAMSLLVKHEQIPPIPDPKLIWLKAQFAERQRRSTIITRIAAVAYAALVALCGIAIYSLTYANLMDSGESFPPSTPLSISSEPVLLTIFAALLVLYLFSPTTKKSR